MEDKNTPAQDTQTVQNTPSADSIESKPVNKTVSKRPYFGLLLIIAGCIVVAAIALGLLLLGNNNKAPQTPNTNAVTVTQSPTATLVPSPTEQVKPRYDLTKLVFPKMPAGYSTEKYGSGNVQSVQIYLKKSDMQSPESVASISNYLPSFAEFDLTKTPSTLDDIMFLGKKYPVYYKENTAHGDGPAMSENECSHSMSGNSHYFITDDNIAVELKEYTYSTFCNGKSTSRTFPDKSDIPAIIRIIEGITTNQ